MRIEDITQKLLEDEGDGKYRFEASAWYDDYMPSQDRELFINNDGGDCEVEIVDQYILVGDFSDAYFTPEQLESESLETLIETYEILEDTTFYGRSILEFDEDEEDFADINIEKYLRQLKEKYDTIDELKSDLAGYSKGDFIAASIRNDGDVDYDSSFYIDRERNYIIFGKNVPSYIDSSFVERVIEASPIVDARVEIYDEEGDHYDTIYLGEYYDLSDGDWDKEAVIEAFEEKYNGKFKEEILAAMEEGFPRYPD